MTKFQKPRVVIGIFDRRKKLVSCLQRLSKDFNYFAMVNSLQDKEKFLDTFSGHNPTARLSDNRIFAWDCREQISMDLLSDGNISDDTRLVAHDILTFDRWIEVKLASQMEASLYAGHSLLFVPVHNTANEVESYRLISNYSAGPIQLHDLPH